MGEYRAVVLGIKRKRPKDTQLETLLYVTKGRLRPLIICLSKSWGGLEQIAVNDALDLAREGIRIFYLCLEGSPTHQHLAGKENIDVLPLNFIPRNYFDVKLKRVVLEILQNHSINLIHCHQTSLLGSLIPWLWRLKHLVIIASRHITNNHIKKNFYYRAIYGRLDAFVVMSEALEKNTLETHALLEKQIWVIPYGIDFNAFNPDEMNSQKQREEWGADDETTVIGLVGRIDTAKGQSTFIKAAAGLMKNKEYLDKKFKFIIVGEETKGDQSGYLEELKEMVKRFSLQEKIVFSGFSSNIPEVMHALDIFVMPSRLEAFGLVAIEAMAMETPVVISMGGSAQEIIGDGDYGLTVRPDDAFDLQSKLKYLLDHPAERKKMAHRAKSFVRSRYDRKERVRRTLELYEWSLRRRGQ